jgi:predicted metal-binding membrane protein
MCASATLLGVMNLRWIAASTLLVLAEECLLRARWLVRRNGAGFVGRGLWLLGHQAWRLAFWKRT